MLATQEAEAGGVLAFRSLRPVWATPETPSVEKVLKISWTWWWCAPVVPATQEAEVGALLEARSSRPVWATW